MVSADVNADVKQQKIKDLVCFTLASNPLITSIALIWKPVNLFAQHINLLVYMWGQHWQLMG